MKISVDWVEDFVDIPKDISPEDIAKCITKHTAEVEGALLLEKRYKNIVIGIIKKLQKHPKADRLNLTLVDIGKDEPVQIVCGGQNLYEGMRVAVALPGALVNLHGEDLLEIKKTKIRDEESNGMICAGEEIWLKPDNDPQAQEEIKIKDLSHLHVNAGTSLSKALNIKGLLLDIDNKSLTHRPDLWGHYGFAREFSAIWSRPLRSLNDLLFDGKEGDVSMKVRIEQPQVCPRFSACIVSGIKIEASPQWMQSRLELAGMKAINNIVDISNYVMLELGQPMHAYDRREIEGDELIVGLGKKEAKLMTLDGNEHTLHEEDPVIYNRKGEALILAGIKGGMKSGIQEDTQEIILEAANWNPVMIRKASTRHQLRTDASQRFEKGLDPSMTEIAVRRALKLIMQICPDAKLISPIENFGSWKENKLNIKVSPKNLCSKIGLQIPREDMIQILRSLGFGVESEGENLRVEVPSHRSGRDINIKEDIMEEIARIYGYEKIPALLPNLPSKLPQQNTIRFYEHKTRNLLAFLLGYTEILTYSFYGLDPLKACRLEEKAHMRVLNYLSEDQSHMRISMVPNILAVIGKNQRRHSLVKIFEIGRTYKESGKYMPLEEKKLIMAIAKKEEPFYDMKGALEDYLVAMGLSSYKLEPCQDPPNFAHPKKCLSINVRGQKVGYMFNVHPGVLNEFDIEKSVAMTELNFDKLLSRGIDEHKFKEPPKFPGISFDISILVDKKMESGSLLKKLKSLDGLIESVEIFDIYEGGELAQEKKSITYRFKLQHKDRTLTDQEFKTVQSKVIDFLGDLGAALRGACAKPEKC